MVWMAEAHCQRISAAEGEFELFLNHYLLCFYEGRKFFLKNLINYNEFDSYLFSK